MATTSNLIPGVVAGNRTVHAVRRVGTYQSGKPRYARICGGRRDNHDPWPAPSATITCKRCLAKVGA